MESNITLQPEGVFISLFMTIHSRYLLPRLLLRLCLHKSKMFSERFLIVPSQSYRWGEIALCVIALFVCYHANRGIRKWVTSWDERLAGVRRKLLMEGSW